MRFFENLSIKAKRNIIVCVGLCVSLIMLSGSKGIETKTSQSKIEDILLEKDKEIEALSSRLNSLENEIKTLHMKNELSDEILIESEELIESTKENIVTTGTPITAIDSGYVYSVTLNCEGFCECNGDVNYPLHLFDIVIENPEKDTMKKYCNVIKPTVYAQQYIEVGDKIGELYNSSLTTIKDTFVPLN